MGIPNHQNLPKGPVIASGQQEDVSRKQTDRPGEGAPVKLEHTSLFKPNTASVDGATLQQSWVFHQVSSGKPWLKPISQHYEHNETRTEKSSLARCMSLLLDQDHQEETSQHSEEMTL